MHMMSQTNRHYETANWLTALIQWHHMGRKQLIDKEIKPSPHLQSFFPIPVLNACRFFVKKV